tara:strand:- start:1966 stop:3249 length:1284 start_codon:yes stop_codon:yes gene_type:complete
MKKFLSLIIISSILVLLIFFSKLFFENNLFNIQDKIYKKYPNLQTSFRKHLFKKDSVIENLNNDYNYKFLPETQFINLNVSSKKFLFSESFEITQAEKKILGGYKNRFKSFFIDEYKDQIIITDYLGGIYSFKTNKLNQNSNSIEPFIVKNNLKTTKVLDSLIYNNFLFVSYIGGDDDCETLNIAKAKLDDLTNLLFEDLFATKECGTYIQAGRMIINKKDNDKTLLISTTDQTPDVITNRPQEDDSIFGKIISINMNDNTFLIYSKGHRNIQGLYSDNNVIIATEHGPRGGDEINNIIKNKNYGWPISSYGELYSENRSENVYFKNHEKYGFEEPIYAFVPSIGISEIINLPNSFSKKFTNNFILTSLYGKNIFRIKFDKNFKKIIFKEKIYIGKRIRDIKYIESKSILVLALEEEGEIGIIKVAN